MVATMESARWSIRDVMSDATYSSLPTDTESSASDATRLPLHPADTNQNMTAMHHLVALMIIILQPS